MQKNLLIIALLTLFGIIASPAYAENTQDFHPERGQKMNTMEARPEENQGQPPQTGQKMMQGQNAPATMQFRMEMKQDMKNLRSQSKVDIQQQKAEFMKEIAAKKESMKVQKQTEKDAFKAKIASLKDERKKISADKIDTKLAGSNQTQTTKMSEALTRLQEILNKLIDKTNEQKAAGKDTTAVETAINNAKTAITTAQSAVAAQAAKTYTANVTDEATLQQNFGTTFAQLRSDLQTTHEKVKLSKDAVKQVAIELMKLESEKAATNDPMPTAVAQ